MQVRQATAEDREELRVLHHRSLRRWVEPVWGWDDELQDQLFAERLSLTDRLVVEAEGTIVATIRTARGDGLLCIEDLQVEPDRQNRGLGTQLLRAALAEADAERIAVRLQLIRGNRAQSLYARHGFQVIEETRAHLVMRRDPEPTWLLRAGRDR